MQPTPRTATSSAKPASFTACSRLFLTASELDDMQPAAMQQRMTVFLRVVRSFSAIALRSSMTIGNPSFHMFECGFGGLPWRDGAIVNDRRRDTASPDAARGQQGKLVVRGGLTGLDFRLFFDRGEHLGSAPDITGGAQANDAGVFALRFKSKEVIERRHSIDATGRQLQLVGHKEQQVVVEETEQFLCLVQNLDERVMSKLVFLHVRLEDLETLVTAGVLHHPVSGPGPFW